MKIAVLTGLFALAALSACSTSKTPEHAIDNPAPAACQAETTQQLVGATDMSDERIKNVTGAGIVRRVGPNQAMTLDYRLDRVTVLIDPTSKRIIRASCG